MSDIDLIEKVEAEHVFASSSRSRDRGVFENVAACTCGHALAWAGREEAFRRHVRLEIVRAVREQIARDIEAQRQPITVHIDYPDVAWDAARKSSARIARGES